MSKGHSPTRFNRGIDDAMLYDATFAQDISNQMRVPKRIKATGDVGDEDMMMGAGIPWEYQDKFDMNVPDRIMLMGQDQHIGTKAPPREITLENSVLPTDPGLIRVNTPPRVITLDHHYFPSAAENTHSNTQYGGWQQTPPQLNGFDERYRTTARQNALKTVQSVEESGVPLSPPTRNSMEPPKYNLNQNDSRRHLRVETMLQYFWTWFEDNAFGGLWESTPLSLDVGNTTGAGEGLSISEELVHLRRQMARLNRRLMHVEMDSVKRQQRERLLYAAGLAFVIMKVLSWLQRN